MNNDGNRVEMKHAPMKVLYSNDTTHIISCTSPYHRTGEAFGQQMLEASVDETADTGVDVHMLQPGLGVVPWWKSKQYPYEQHFRWFEKTYRVNVDDNLYAQYMLNGGDMVEAFVQRCRQNSLACFVSLRMNDGHGKEFVDQLPNAEAISQIPGFTLHCLNHFYKEHPEYRFELPGEKRVLNWAHAEVREWMFGFIRELCEQYDLDGFELDFMRFLPYFHPEETTHDQRVEIMTAFIDRVRTLLDQSSQFNRRRWLCVRVPAFLDQHGKMGLDLPRWVDAGVDMVNLSFSYISRQDGDLEAIRKMIPNTRLYVELTHTTRLGPWLPADSIYDTATYRRATDEQFYTAAHRAYSRGLDGVSLFNFPYYRQHGHPGRAPFHEPPFHIVSHIGDPAWLAKQPQHYFISKGLMGQTLKADQSFHETFDMAVPNGGWRKGGKLRIQAIDDLGESHWKAYLNGQELEETDDRNEPYEQPYAGLIGTPQQHRAWTVPAGFARDRNNFVQIKLVDGEEAAVIFVDLAIS